jgi:hypothetical protein
VKRAVVALLLVGVAASAAWGYVRSRTPKGIGVTWSGTCVFMQPDSTGSPDLPLPEIITTLQQSMANWQNAVGSQAYLKLMYMDPAPLEAHLDGANIVKFRTDRWCHPNDEQQQNICYSSAAAGITTVFFIQDGSDHAGTILDADIELNDINFTFAILPTTTQPRPGTQIADLENTLTHELGHVQGLDHTCKDSATPPQEVDENGNPPPPCDQVFLLPIDEQQKIRLATMYNYAQPGETIKRTPEADDVAGIANAYPPGNDPSSCKTTDLNAFMTRGCTVGAVGAAPAPSLAVLALVLGPMVAVAARRRRRNRLTQ